MGNINNRPAGARRHVRSVSTSHLFACPRWAVRSRFDGRRMGPGMARRRTLARLELTPLALWPRAVGPGSAGLKKDATGASLLLEMAALRHGGEFARCRGRQPCSARPGMAAVGSRYGRLGLPSPADSGRPKGVWALAQACGAAAGNRGAPDFGHRLPFRDCRAAGGCGWVAGRHEPALCVIDLTPPGVSRPVVDHAGVIMSGRVVIMVMRGFCCRTW